MRVLFVHNNFPAQFGPLARHLAKVPGVEMAAVGAQTAREVPGVRLVRYPRIDTNVAATHPFARRFDLECRRAEQVLYALSALRAQGFVPDVILAHPGWGETMPLRTIFPKARIIAYCEFFYASEGRDVGFDPEFPTTGVDGHVGLHIKNAATLLALAECDVGIAPTAWQRSIFPPGFHDKIRVVHEGVDVDRVAPDPSAVVQIPGVGALTRANEVVTFVARNLEPLRGFHVFMRSLPAILAARPNAHVVIVGGDGVSYGAPPPAGTTWRALFEAEVAGGIDRRRVHFLGQVPYERYLNVLGVSRAHVYLTYPFVLSWSLLEAMSAGCVVIGSDTPPVREVLDGENGLIVPFFDSEAIAAAVVGALAAPAAHDRLRQRARQTVLDRFDMQRRCLPQMLALVRGDGATAAPSVAAPSPGEPAPQPERRAPRVFQGARGGSA
jgi:glycosyltransferase involved in cell wall biosynthesis